MAVDTRIDVVVGGLGIGFWRLGLGGFTVLDTFLMLLGFATILK